MFPIDEELPPDSTTVSGFLLRAIAANRANVAAVTAAHFGISRQAVNRHLRALTKQGLVIANGSTKARHYQLYAKVASVTHPLVGGPDESTVWADFVAPRLKGLDTALRNCQYAFTEIYNNAIDHSDGSGVTVFVSCSAATVTMTVLDNGIGIWNKLIELCAFEDEQAAMLDLVKGKLTTDSSRHTGFGIFYSSRLCDSFGIVSGRHMFSHAFNHVGDESEIDWTAELPGKTPGTFILMSVDTRPLRTLDSVFQKYSVPGSVGLDITHVPVALAQNGQERLVSRSQAKRLAVRFDWFRRVLLDFKGVETIGQAFADELFRVWQREHPQVTLVATNATPMIEQLIQSARSALAAESTAAPIVDVT